LTPAASVGVAEMHLIRRSRNASSTRERWSLARPAWWNADPCSTASARSSEVSVSETPRISSASSRRSSRSASVSRAEVTSVSLRAEDSALRRELTKTSRGAALSRVLLGVERVPDETGRLVLAAVDGHLAFAAVVEVDGVAEVDAAAEVDRSPLRLDEFGVEPLRDHVGVADRRRERDRLEAGVDLAELREGDFERGTAVRVVDEVDLVAHDAGEVVDPRRAVADQRVDLLRGGDDDVAGGEPLAVGVVVARGDADGDPVVFPAFELGLLLARERAERDDVESLPAAFDRREHGEFRDQRLAGRRGDRRDEALPVDDAGLDGGLLRRVQLGDALGLKRLADARGEPAERTRLHYPWLVPVPV